MKRLVLAAALAMTASSAGATGVPDFSGRWNFDAAKSQNTGMMAQATVVTTVTQTATTLTADDHATFGGQPMDGHTIYDLTGAPAHNTSRTSGTGTARSRWDGARLVTEWEIEGAVADSTIKRVETRYLSQDGRKMFVESRRAGMAPVVMAFDPAQ